MEDEKLYHLIDEYLNGELQGTALDKFRIDIKNSEELQNRVQLQKEIIAAIRVKRDAELKAKLNAAKSSSSRQLIIHPSMKVALASAAAITLLVVAYFAVSPYISQSITKANHTLDNESLEEKTAISKDSQKEKLDTQSLAIQVPPPPPESIMENINDMVTTQEQVKEESNDAELLDEAPDANSETVDIKKESSIGQDDNIIIAKDELLSSRTYTVLSITADFSTTTESQVSTTAKSGSVPAKRDKADIGYDKDVELKSPNSSYKSKNVSVEYWKSVVNYKGYKYDGNKVQLYGIENNKPLVFKELDDRLYVRIDSKQYFIEKNNSYKRLTEVTNPNLLNVLND